MAEHHPAPGTDPFEQHVANAIAQALGERKVRLTDRRMLLLWLVVMLLFGALGTYVSRSEHDRVAFERQITSNCYVFNRFVTQIQTTTRASKVLTKREIRQRVAFYEKAKQTCPPPAKPEPVVAVSAGDSWRWSWVPVPVRTHFGDRPGPDWLRVLACGLGIIILWSCGRTILEQRRRVIPMPPGQVARLLALGLASVSLSLTEIAVMGQPAGPRLVTTLIIDAISIWGIIQIRTRQQGEEIVRG